VKTTAKKTIALAGSRVAAFSKVELQSLKPQKKATASKLSSVCRRLDGSLDCLLYRCSLTTPGIPSIPTGNAERRSRELLYFFRNIVVDFAFFTTVFSTSGEMTIFLHALCVNAHRGSIYSD
jgi:hypothetical protein